MRCSFFDAMLAEGVGRIRTTLLDAEPELVLLYEDTFNFLSKMCLAECARLLPDDCDGAQRAGAGNRGRIGCADPPEPYLTPARMRCCWAKVWPPCRSSAAADSNPDAALAQLIDGLSGTPTLAPGEPIG